MYWTDERVELLRKLWDDGLSVSQIADRLGGQVTRNAVVGKVHRLKLTGRGRVSPALVQPKKPAAIPARVAHTPSEERVSVARFEPPPVRKEAVRPTEAVVVPISRRLALTELTERTCKWPNGDPVSEDFSYCGNEAGASGPYCTYHRRIAYQPRQVRQRAR